MAVLLGLVLLFYAFAMRPHPSAIAWSTDLDASLLRARTAQRPLLVEFHTSWCGPCENMDRDVFSRTDVADAMKEWVPVRIDADQQVSLAQQYSIEGYPTFLVMRPDGQVVRRELGGLDAGDFIAFLRSAESSARVPATSTSPG